MGGCSAVNCSNSSYSKDPSKKRRVFKFPTDPNRRQQWFQNCRRDKWIPNENAVLCEDHFENSQFESNRADGWRKLKPNVIPTLFNVPNPPKLLDCPRIKGIGMPKDKKTKWDTEGTSTSSEIGLVNESEHLQGRSSIVTYQDSDALNKRIKELEAMCSASNILHTMFKIYLNKKS